MNANNDFIKVLVDVVHFSIYGMGVFGLVLILERAKALFVDYSIKGDIFMKQIKSLVEIDKIEEAITYCAANDKKPLAHVVKKILERADRDDRSIEQALDIAVGEVAPNIAKRIGYLAMIGNVVTMLGLLGTVGGLIMSFQAVSFADPTQKQILLAQGISIAMHATALGLFIAIPVMVVYSFLHAKQGRLFSEIDRCSTMVLDLLRSRGYYAFSEAAAFPANTGTPGKMAAHAHHMPSAPKTNPKVS